MIVGAMLALLALPRWRPVEQTLADGTILRIEAVTFGTNHVFSKHPIRERIRNVLPKRLKPFLGKGNFTASVETAPDCAVLWTMRFDPVTQTYISSRDEQHYAVDEHGCRFHSNYRRGTTLAGNMVVGIVLDAFPRRGEHFDYIIIDKDSKVLGQMRIPNPQPARLSQRWIPEKLPIAKTNSEPTVELRRFAYRPSGPRAFSDYDIRLLRLADLESWDKSTVWVCDSSGNRSFFNTLCTNESAWKIEANFFRKAHAEFRRDEIWTLTNIAIPAPGAMVRLHRTNIIQGCVVAVESLWGPGYVEPGRSGEVRRVPPDARPASTTPAAPALFIWSRHWNSEMKILIRARDDSGRKLVTHAYEDSPIGYSVHAGNWRQRLDIQTLADSKFLNVEVLVQKATKVEFFVDPAEATDRPAYRY